MGAGGHLRRKRACPLRVPQGHAISISFDRLTGIARGSTIDSRLGMWGGRRFCERRSRADRDVRLTWRARWLHNREWLRNWRSSSRVVYFCVCVAPSRTVLSSVSLSLRSEWGRVGLYGAGGGSPGAGDAEVLACHDASDDRLGNSSPKMGSKLMSSNETVLN